MKGQLDLLDLQIDGFEDIFEQNYSDFKLKQLCIKSQKVDAFSINKIFF